MDDDRTATAGSGLARASAADTLRVAAEVGLPLVARGLIVRRPRVVALLERLDADRRAVRLLQRLRRRYGPGPLRLRVPGRSAALILAPEHVQRVLDGTPEPFTPATREKVGALGRFEPHGLLVSPPHLRPDRRAFNEAVLDASRSVHHLAPRIVPTVREEAAALLEGADRSGRLTWDGFAPAWWRTVRRVVLGDAAADDHETTDLLARLRADGNWGQVLPFRRHDARHRFDRRVRDHVDRAEPGSLAALVATVPAAPGTVPHQQVPQWLFAFDAAGIATFRALALLAAHPAVAHDVRRELAGRDLSAPQDLPLLRACLLEALRLWPTTPGILRDTTEETRWEGGVLPAGTSLVVLASFFHRDDEHLPEADRFAPELWSRERTGDDWPLVPFSAGPAACPGRNLVLLVASTMLAALLDGRELRMASPARLDAARPLPSLLDPYSLRFEVRPG